MDKPEVRQDLNALVWHYKITCLSNIIIFLVFLWDVSREGFHSRQLLQSCQQARNIGILSEPKLRTFIQFNYVFQCEDYVS